MLYDDRKVFQEIFNKVDGIKENIIMGGDFNLTEKVAETWGEGSRKETLDG